MSGIERTVSRATRQATRRDSRAAIGKPARVVFTGDFSDRYTGGVKEFAIEAKTLRGVIRTLDERYPGLGACLEKETTVALDGVLHEIVYQQPVRPGCEIFFIPKIEGG